jgi:hypothetical protein
VEFAVGLKALPSRRTAESITEKMDFDVPAGRFVDHVDMYLENRMHRRHDIGKDVVYDFITTYTYDFEGS